MQRRSKVLLIDAGNTAIKLAEFVDDELVTSFRLNKNEFLAHKKKSIQDDYDSIVLSSVLNEESNRKLFDDLINVKKIDFSNPPYGMMYLTPETLGQDRKCNAAYLMNRGNSKTKIVIDIGTCIKFDVVHENVFIGGSISPGVDLRYKALNEFTGNLPLLDTKEPVEILGRNTNENIWSGVINGIQEEINGFIRRYEHEYNDLTFFMTGGDAQYFDLHSKNDIFADENLTLIGLYEIYKHNA